MSLAEGTLIDKNNPCMINIGDIMYDVLGLALEHLENRPSILENIRIAEQVILSDDLASR